eukprot:1489534-Rhodomonas_salina.3
MAEDDADGQDRTLCPGTRACTRPRYPGTRGCTSPGILVQGVVPGGWITGSQNQKVDPLSPTSHPTGQQHRQH